MALFVLISLLPLCASVILVLGGRRWSEYGHRIGISAIWLSFGLSVLAFLEVLNNGPFSLSLYRLFQSGSLVVDLNLFVDQLTVLLLLLVTGVSGIVHVYSSRYMIGDPQYNHFCAVIALFTFSMIVLVMSGNLLMLLICWEVMGLCSYLLISHWAHRTAACRAATKAFLVNAVADIGFSFGIILTFVTFGTLDIQTILAQAESMKDQTINVTGWLGWDVHVNPVTLIPVLFFIGAMGKSAQIPFHVWLPYAMEAPTPVSALIHAATMVNAGPFLLVRLSPLIMLSPVAMTAIAIIGLVTVFVTSVYLFRSVPSLFVHAPRTYWTTSGQPALEERSIHPRFVDGPILGGLVLATVLVGVTLALFWSWFAGFLGPAVTPPGVSLAEAPAGAGFPVWIPLSICVAFAGWAFAYSMHIRPRQEGSQADAAGPFLRQAEAHTIQHQLLVMILWLVLAIGTLYLLV